jgi:peptide/nickel transport system substrate-binding protein
LKQLYSLMLLMMVLVLAGCDRAPDNPAATPAATEAADVVATPTTAIAEAEETATAETPIEATAEATATATSVPATATPVPPKILTVCMAQEPENLFLYGGELLAAQAVRHAIYENIYTQLDYGYQAQGLEKLPNLDDGDARLQAVEVTAGALVVDSLGHVLTLRPGVTMITAAGETVTFGGDPITVNQMQADFTFKPMVWSDGVAVTAEDSVYSFQVAADPLVALDKTRIDRTASYEATGELTVRWTGLPGWIDSHYFLNVWPPLPQHQLGGLTVAELFNSEEATRRPLSSGPFVVESWTAGERIELVANPHYYRAAEGLPHLEGVTFKFVPDTQELISMAAAGDCDVMAQDNGLGALQQAEGGLDEVMTRYVVVGPIFEHLDFGITGYFDERPDWFEDVRVRQAITQCIDRPRMVAEQFGDQASLMNGYVPDSHPLYPAGQVAWPYDVAAANGLLDQVGYGDTDGDGIREDPATAIPFRIVLQTTSGTALRPALAAIVQSNLRECGIDVEIEHPSDLFAGGPEGPVFGRYFDLAIFAWLSQTEPPCHLYTTAQIPGPIEVGYAAGWQGLNVTGWSNAEFDAACLAAQQAFYGTPAYVEAHQRALGLFLQNVPSIPLFAHPKVAAARPEVVNFELDPTQPSELWNLFEMDLEQGG